MDFYTTILDFEEKYPDKNDAVGVIDLINGAVELQLSHHAGDGAFGCAINIRVHGVDEIYKKYRERGLDTNTRPDSPVHCGPVNQTWGIREFYVSDRDGNTLRFGEPINPNLELARSAFATGPRLKKRVLRQPPKYKNSWITPRFASPDERVSAYQKAKPSSPASTLPATTRILERSAFISRTRSAK